MMKSLLPCWFIIIITIESISNINAYFNGNQTNQSNKEHKTSELTAPFRGSVKYNTFFQKNKLAGKTKSVMALKKAIVPERRGRLRQKLEQELEEHLHNETHRPDFPEKEISPDIKLKYPAIPDPLLIPLKPNEVPAPALQPIVVVPPPAPPPPPMVIQTGSGPAATVTQPIPVPPSASKPFLDKLPGPIVGAGGVMTPAQAAAGGGGGGGAGGGGSAAPSASTGGYVGSGPARGGEAGLAGPDLGSGSGDGDTSGEGIGHGADWNGAGIPSPGAKYAGSPAGVLPGNQQGSGKLIGLPGVIGGGIGPGGVAAAAAAGGGEMASLLMGFCCRPKGGDVNNRTTNVTALCQLFKQYHKNLKCVEKIVKANADVTTAGMAEISQGSRPIQIARGFLGAELFRLEDIIGNLNKKIDIIGDRVTKRPNQLARASLMAGMTSTFGDLQNTIELLNQKLDRKMNPSSADLVSTQPDEQREHTKEINILSKQLDQLGGAGWLGSKGIGLGLHRYEEELKQAQQKGMDEAQLKSSQRLEELMHLVADRLMGLSDMMDHPSHLAVQTVGSGMDPLVRQEEEGLMAKQLQVQHQMGLIQVGLQALTNAVVKLDDARKAPRLPIAIPQKFIELVRKVFGNAANAFRGIAKQTGGTGNHIVNVLNHHVANANTLGDNLLSAGHTIDSKLDALNRGDESVSGLVDSLAASYGNVAGGALYGGTLHGIHGANDAIPAESIPQLAAGIAMIPAAGEQTLDAQTQSQQELPSIEGIAQYMDSNPVSFGSYANSEMGVVTGNLGGSMGLGGIGGIDGGNALVMNETSKTKRTIQKNRFKKYRLNQNLQKEKSRKDGIDVIHGSGNALVLNETNTKTKRTIQKINKKRFRNVKKRNLENLGGSRNLNGIAGIDKGNAFVLNIIKDKMRNTIRNGNK